jgi:hypothetical protein
MDMLIDKPIKFSAEPARNLRGSRVLMLVKPLAVIAGQQASTCRPVFIAVLLTGRCDLSCDVGRVGIATVQVELDPSNSVAPETYWVDPRCLAWAPGDPIDWMRHEWTHTEEVAS